MARYSDLFLDQGSTLSYTFTTRDANNAPVNLTAYTVRSKMKPFYSTKENTLSGIISTQSGNTTILGSNTKFLTELEAGEFINANNETLVINTISSNTQLSAVVAPTTTAANISYTGTDVIIVTCTKTDAVNGTVEISILPHITAALDRDRYVLDVELVAGSGNVTRILESVVFVSKEATT